MSAESRGRTTRYLSAAVGIPFGVGVCLLSPILFSITATVLIAVGAVEFFAMARHRGFSPHSVIGTLCSIAICLLAWKADPLTLLYSLAASVTVVCTAAMARNARDALANTAVTVFGIFYVGWFCGHIILLRHLPLPPSEAELNFGGAGYVIMLLVLLWLGDGGAFFAGTAWGRHKLVPVISPNKTIEGAIGGIAITLVGALLIQETGTLFETFNIAIFPDWEYPEYLLVGLGIAVIGQVGDLCESYFKRDAGLKDTGNLIPGHGGFLDRFDSMILTAPLLYYYLNFRNP